MMRGALCPTFVIAKVCRWGCLASAQTQTQQTMPPAKAQFGDGNGVPALVLRVRLNSRPE
jgi:hypothetical protein